ncbi:MAG: hypothetical protein M1376_07995 [Planctomycetes bacterium]|nr:hypothetical protein [Planctomycetota bacterium]
MQWKWALVLGLLGAFLTGGCSRPLQEPADDTTVIVEGGGPFPRSLAGRWQASQHGWEFELTPDGRIASAILSLGRVRIVPGKTTTMPTRGGHQAVFTPGPWTVHYLPGTRELTVEIIMNHVRMEMGGTTLEGSCTDTFVGPVAASKRAWQVQWTTFTRYLAHTPDGAVVNLSTDPTYGETKSLTFEKTDDRVGS